MAIHSTSQIDKTAEIGNNVTIGAYSIIGPNVKIGDNTTIAPNVLIECNTTLGEDSFIYKGAAIGVAPQDNKYKGDERYLEIGKRAVLREHSTIARGSEKSTIVGNDFILMSHGHLSHDCEIGNNVILSNSVIVMGHVIIEDHVIVASLSFINRFCRIGKLSFIGGGSRVVKDVPPFILVAGEPLQISGINSIALEKQDFSKDTLEKISEVYKAIYADKANLTETISKLKKESEDSIVTNDILGFIENSQKGIL